MSERRHAERRQQPRHEDSPTIIEMRAVFHRPWSSQVGQSGYRKKDWQELQRMLLVRYKLQL